MTLENQQKLVLAIIEFLNQSIQNGTVASADRESLEVAVQCIGEAFGVDPSDESQRERLSIKPATLQVIFDVFLKTRAQHGSSSAPGPSGSKAPSAEDKTNAEKLKQAGNVHMTNKRYDEAIASYTKAIELDGSNAVYYSNRAAAHSSKGDHLSAAIDAEKAIEVDATFVKGYSRLGHAHYSLGDYKEAASAFHKGLQIDPSNDHLKSSLQNAQARIASDDMPDLVPEPDISSRGASSNAGTGGGMSDFASMLNNPTAGAGGGMPDLASMLNNPMMMMQMAQQMMQNGGLESLMSNPAVANMMNRAQSGAMPSMEELMSDPQIGNLASQFAPGARGRSSSGRI